MHAIDHAVVRHMVTQALAEDIGTGDVTADLLPGDWRSQAQVITREPGTLCGQAWFEETFRALDPDVHIQWFQPEGGRLRPDDLLCEIGGRTRALLTGERAALNFLQTLSGTATRVGAYVAAVHGTGSVILDTRKTIPGWRLAQKYAVVVGGGRNHRLGLYDAVLIKENHIAAAGSLTEAIRRARALHPGLPVEVEVETLPQLDLALTERPERILLDNFSLEMIRVAVARTQGGPPLEVSGGVSLGSVRELAETGVAYISVGDITKNIRALDLSMRVTLPTLGAPSGAAR